MKDNDDALGTTVTPTTINIGEVLRRAGAVTQKQIDRAVAIMSDHDMKLGEALVAIGACSKADVDIALDRQQRIAQGQGSAVRALDELLQDTFKAAATAAKLAIVACYIATP